jgi:hypothetical protein
VIGGPDKDTEVSVGNGEGGASASPPRTPQHGRFREVHDALFGSQRERATLDFDIVLSQTSMTGVPAWSECRSDSLALARLRQDSVAVAALGVSETPTVIVGDWRFRYPPTASSLASAVERVRNGRRPRGAGLPRILGQ